MSGSQEALVLSKDGHNVVFDLCIHTNKGMIFAMKIKRDEENQAPSIGAAAMPLERAHQLMGHFGPALSRKTAKYLKWKVKAEDMGPCEACACGKARRKNLNKSPEHQSATATAYRLFTDIATIKPHAGLP